MSKLSIDCGPLRKTLASRLTKFLREAVALWLAQPSSKIPDQLGNIESATEPPAGFTEAEAIVIKRTLEKFNGNKTAAAAALGISTRTLYRKLEKL